MTKEEKLKQVGCNEWLINKNKKAMEIDVKKILGKTPKDAFEAVEQMNKERMIKYFDKFSKMTPPKEKGE